MQNLLENELVSFQYDPSKKILKSTYKGLFNYQLSKDIYENQIDSVLNVNATIKVADMRNLRGSFMRIMDNLIGLYPILKKRGLKAEVFIISDDLIIKHLIGIVCEKLNSLGIDTYTCSSLKEADSWIERYLKK